MKKQLIITMLILLALGWYITTDTFLGRDVKYNEEISRAKELEAKEIYITAISHYETALTYKQNDYNAMYGIAQDYKMLDEMNNYEKQLKTMLTTFNADKRILSELYDYYIENDSMNAAAELVYNLKKEYPENEYINQLYEERKGDYTEKFSSFEKISSYMNGVAVFSRNGKKGIIDDEGDVEIDARYDEIGYPSGDDEYIAVVDEGKAYFINENGYKIAEPENVYTYLGNESSGCVLAKKSGKYGYLDEEYEEKTEFIWDDATAVYSGIGAVKKGERWALIDQDCKLITDYIYDDVLQNDWNICSENEVVWVVIDGKYQLVDKKGSILTGEVYDNAKCFVSDEPCAVMKSGQWGFINADGTEYLSPQYEEADSFHMGFAPVMNQRQWGLIDEKGILVLDYYFDEMRPLNEDGVIPVKKEELWSLIQLKIFE